MTKNVNEITEMKAKIFDVMCEIEFRQQQITELIKGKNELLVEIAKKQKEEVK